MSLPSRSESVDPPIDRCPFCEDEGKESKGHYDSRVMVGGRGLWICDEDRGHRWQDADEGPRFSGKDYVIRP